MAAVRWGVEPLPGHRSRRSHVLGRLGRQLEVFGYDELFRHDAVFRYEAMFRHDAEKAE